MPLSAQQREDLRLAALKLAEASRIQREVSAFVTPLFLEVFVALKEAKRYDPRLYDDANAVWLAMSDGEMRRLLSTAIVKLVKRNL